MVDRTGAGWPPEAGAFGSEDQGRPCAMCAQPISGDQPGLDEVCGGCWEVIVQKLNHSAGALELMFAGMDGDAVDLELSRPEAAILCRILREYVQLRLAALAWRQVEEDSNEHQQASVRSMVAFRLVTGLEGELTDEDFEACGG